MASLSTPLWRLHAAEDEALRILGLMACPAPCIGRRDPDGEDWHELCEHRARQALWALRGPLQPQDYKQPKPRPVDLSAVSS